MRRTIRAVATKAFSHKTQGMRRAHAAARPLPQQPQLVIIIQLEGKPWFTQDDIDKVYDQQLGGMFEGEEGGHLRRLAGAGVFI